MNSRSGGAPQTLAEIFPRIYYFFRCVSEHNSEVRDEMIKFDEPMDALLWFLELKGAKTRETACPKKDLMNLVYRWYGATTTLQRSYKRLSTAGLIESAPGRDGRIKVIWLTKEGSSLLNQFKQQRHAELSILWQGLKEFPAADHETLIECLSKMAKTACERMLQDIKDEPFKNAINNKARKSGAGVMGQRRKRK